MEKRALLGSWTMRGEKLPFFRRGEAETHGTGQTQKTHKSPVVKYLLDYHPIPFSMKECHHKQYTPKPALGTSLQPCWMDPVCFCLCTTPAPPPVKST